MKLKPGTLVLLAAVAYVLTAVVDNVAYWRHDARIRALEACR